MTKLYAGPSYLPWDKGFIALAKKSIQIMIYMYIFFLFFEENTSWILIPSVVRPSVFLFPDNNLSRKYQWIFTKLVVCFVIVEIWFGMANGQISSILSIPPSVYF